MLDLVNGRRDTPERARWWKSVNKKKVSEIVKEESSVGYFRFKQVNTMQHDKEITGGGFQYDVSSITIMTHDIVRDINANDIVELRKQTFIVVSVQRKPIAKTTYMRSRPSEDTYIELRSA